MAEKISYQKHRRVLDKLRDRHANELRMADQRALEIKEGEREKALELAREAQGYRDEQANKLREQISSERGSYATKDDIKPLIAFVATQQGRSGSNENARNNLFAVLGVLGTVVGIVGTIVAAVAIVLTRGQ